MDPLEVRKTRIENAKNIVQIVALIVAGAWGDTGAI